MSNILNVLDNIESKILARLNELKNNPNSIEYWEDCGDGGFWRPFTEEIAAIDYPWKLSDLRIRNEYLKICQK